MKKFLKTAVVLASICAVSAVLLAAVNKVTAPAIEKYEQEVVMKALEDVACGMEIGGRTEVSDNENISYYHVLSKSGQNCGYILGLKSNGYGGQLILVASYDEFGKLLAAKLVSDSETPGVGKKAENEGYMDKFIGKGSDVNPIPTAKSMLTDVEASSVSGASMTFNGVSRALHAGCNFVKSLTGGDR